MNCKQAQQSLNAMIDGTLFGEKARMVRSHLASCEECASALTSAQWVEVLPALEEDLELPADFAPRFHQKLDQRQISWRARLLQWRWTNPLFASGGVAAIFALGLLIGNHSWIKPDNDLDSESARIVEKVSILQDMALVNDLELLEDFEIIKDLPNLLKEESKN
jgi:anti-sigma factor RsiW